MTKVEELIDELDTLGVKLELNGDKINVAPKSKVTPEMLSRMKEHRDQLIAHLSDKEVNKLKSQENIIGPSSPPEASALAEDATKTMPQSYGGIQRLEYLGILIVVGILESVVLMGVAAANPSGESMGPIQLLFTAILFIPVYYRLKNIGMNPWWCLLMLVPIANLFLGVRCLIFQEGYADTKKLDTAGKVISYIALGIFVLLIGSVIVAVSGS